VPPRLADAVRFTTLSKVPMTSLATPPEHAKTTAADTKVEIATDSDIVSARQRGRTVVSRLGFSATEATLVATAVSELARNIVLYAGRGEIVLRPLDEAARRGILVIARDEGPGIPDLQRALGGGYSTRGGRGMGLSGTMRLVDEFEITSAAGSGTTVAVTMWSRTVRAQD
jgi:serine/threonine-protein kinase RsbT